MNPIKLINGPADGEIKLCDYPMPKVIEFSLDGKTWHEYKYLKPPGVANPSKGLQAGVYHEFEFVEVK